jgi:hypothetical protein
MNAPTGIVMQTVVSLRDETVINCMVWLMIVYGLLVIDVLARLLSRLAIILL